jgi:ethanolamine utilization protein EutM
MAIEAAAVLEAPGFVPIFEAVDAMVKATQVKVGGVVRLGGGLVAVTLTGELAALEEALEIGEASARTISPDGVKSIVFANPSAPVFAVATEPKLVQT